jgi:hypothetical protein
MEKETEISTGTPGSVLEQGHATSGQESGGLLASADPVWLAIILLCAIIIVARRMGTSNVERNRPIQGGHYQGKVTPSWYQTFMKRDQSEEPGMFENVPRTDLQSAIRKKRK